MPCKPQNASAQLNCNTNSAVVSWELSDNVTRHTVQAIGSDGHRIDCTSSEHSCTLADMHCGQSYNITVTALDGVCDNSNTHLILKSGESADSFEHLMTEKPRFNPISDLKSNVGYSNDHAGVWLITLKTNVLIKMVPVFALFQLHVHLAMFRRLCIVTLVVVLCLCHGCKQRGRSLTWLWPCLMMVIPTLVTPPLPPVIYRNCSVARFIMFLSTHWPMAVEAWRALCLRCRQVCVWRFDLRYQAKTTVCLGI